MLHMAYLQLVSHRPHRQAQTAPCYTWLLCSLKQPASQTRAHAAPAGAAPLPHAQPLSQRVPAHAGSPCSTCRLLLRALRRPASPTVSWYSCWLMASSSSAARASTAWPAPAPPSCAMLSLAASSTSSWVIRLSPSASKRIWGAGGGAMRGPGWSAVREPGQGGVGCEGCGGGLFNGLDAGGRAPSQGLVSPACAQRLGTSLVEGHGGRGGGLLAHQHCPRLTASGGGMGEHARSLTRDTYNQAQPHTRTWELRHAHANAVCAQSPKGFVRGCPQPCTGRPAAQPAHAQAGSAAHHEKLDLGVRRLI